MELVDLSKIASFISNARVYLYNNITLPRVSSTYSSSYELPSSTAVVVGLSEIIGTIHPNYYAIALLFVCVAGFIYIKIKYPFWNTQPVVHTYDIWFSREARILHKIPYKSRFYDKESVSTTDYFQNKSREPTLDKNEIVVFLQSHYIPTDRLLSTISIPVLDVYMSGHNAPSFLSVHRELDHRLTGVITSRLSNIYLYDGNTHTCVNAYYVDFMCIHRECAGRGIAERLFHTHEYNRRIQNPLIPISLFSKDGARCEGIIPFIEYTTYTYYMRDLKLQPLPFGFTISRVVKQTSDLVHDIYHILTNATSKTHSLFSVCILPDIGNLLALLSKNELYLFCLKNGDHLYGIYFFRNTHIHYEELDGETLDLIATIQNNDNPIVFMSGFIHSLREILKENRQYKMLRIPSIGHNQTIITKWREYHHSILETPGSMYLYNYMVPKMPSDAYRCLVVV